MLGGVEVAAEPRLIGKLIIEVEAGIGAAVGAEARIKEVEEAGLREKVEVEPKGGAEIGGVDAGICLEGAGGAGGERSIEKAKVEVEEEGRGTAKAAETEADLRFI